MKKILLILTTILSITSGAWAQSVPTFTATNPESLADGWYQIKWITTNGASDYTDAEVEGKFVTNYPGDVTVNNKKYSLFLDNAPTTLDEHAKTFVYLEGRVSDDTAGSHGNLRSANGHYISRTGESSTTKPDANYIIYFSKGSYPNNSTITSSTSAGSRISLEPQGNNAIPYIGQTNTTEKFPMVQFSPVNLSSIGLQAWTVNFVVQTDITIEYTGSQNYGIDKVYNGGKFFFAQGVTPEASDFTINGTDPNYDANPVIIIDSENKIIKITQHANRDITVPDGHNGYVGYNTNISDSEWKTKEYWKLNDDWYSNGPGNKETSGDRGMWSPIYLKDITDGTVPALEGWNFRMVADHSTYEIASVGKIQYGSGVNSYLTLKNNSIVTMNMGTGSANPFTVNLNEGTGNNLTFAMSSNFGSSITVNYGSITTSTNRKFNASGTGTISTLNLNATFTEPAEYNNVEEITLVTFDNVSASTITTTNITPVGSGWIQVDSKAALETQTNPGKFYYIEKITNTGVKLYTYKTQIYNVAANSTETLSQISEYESYKFFNVPENSTLIIDINNFDLTKITGSGTINLTANTTLSEGQSISAKLSGSGTITLNYFPTAETHPTFSNEWTGSIEFADDNTSRELDPILNVWGNTNSTINLNNAKGYFTAGATVAPTINILSGKTLTIDNGNSNTDYPTLEKVTGSGDLALTFHPYYNEQVFNLTINNLIGFKGTLNGQYRPIIVKNFVLNGIPKQQIPIDDNLLFKTLNTVYFSKTDYDSKIFINNEEKTAVYAWEKRNNSTEGYYVSEYAPSNISKALNLVNPYNEGNYLGTSIGKYTISLGSTTYTDYGSFYNTVVNMQTISDWEGITVSVAINQPTTGYYYIKSKYNESTGYYLSCENNNDGKAIQTTTTDAKNIFYIEVGENNSTILSYSTGFYFGNDTRANYTSVTDDPIKWTFSEGANKGTYTLTSTYTGSKILFGWSGDGEKSYADRNGAITTDGHTDWILEEVTEIPVTFNSNALGYATFNSPVALKVPTDIKAYICTIDGNTIKLYNADEIKDGNNWVLPAETPVLLYNEFYDQVEKGTANFVVTSIDETNIYSSKNEFSGTVAAARPESGQTYYALRKKFDSTNSTYSMGFYQRSDQNADLTGFRAWIKIPKNQARNFTVIFDGDSDPTGIVEALGLQDDDNVEIYDLSGRKLSSYQKGINIVNGKKVFK